MKLLLLVNAAVHASSTHSVPHIAHSSPSRAGVHSKVYLASLSAVERDVWSAQTSYGTHISKQRPTKVPVVDEIVIDEQRDEILIDKKRHKITGQKILFAMFIVGSLLVAVCMFWARRRLPPSYGGDVLALMRRTWPLILGNTIEWYEFGIYGYTALQIEANFFEGSALATWLGYAVTFVARPFGGLVLGWVADKFGRSISVRLSLIGMLVGTVGQGCLPGHHWGRALEIHGLVLLLFLRSLQGISAGGEIGAISAYMMEVAPEHALGWASMLIALGGAFGFGLAALVCDLLYRELGDEQMLVWGWRVPFLISLFPGLVALAGRNLIPETEAFKEAANEAEAFDEKAAAYELLRHRYPALLVGGGATIGIGTMWYVGPVWTASGLLAPNLGAETALSIASGAQFISLLFTPFVGMLTDIKGIAWVALLGSSVIAITSLPVWMMIAFSPSSLTLAYLGIAGMFGIAQAFGGATIYLFSAELFPTRLRTIGMGMSYNLAVSYFGGFGPALCEILKDYSQYYGPGMWMSFCGCLSIFAVLCGLSLERQGLLKLTHRRAQPYFGSLYGADGKVVVKAASLDCACEKSSLTHVAA